MRTRLRTCVAIDSDVPVAPIQRLQLTVTQVGDGWVVSGLPARWHAFQPALDSASRGEDSGPIWRSEDFSGDGWSARDVEVDAETRRLWREYEGWDDEDEADDPLRFCEVTGGEHAVVCSWFFLTEAVHQVANVVRETRETDEWKRRERELEASIAAIVRVAVDWAAPPGADLKALEDRARDLEEKRIAQADKEGDPNGDERRALLRDLHSHGIFDRENVEIRATALVGFPELLAYHSAGQDLLDYLEDPIRATYGVEIRAATVLGSPVSVDWFRLGPWIGGIVDSTTWLAWGEATLFERRDWKTGNSWMYWHSGSVSEVFVFRMDNDHRASLVKVGRPVPGARARPSDFEIGLEPPALLETAAARVHEYAPTNLGTLVLVTTLLSLRLNQTPNAGNAWYRLGLALLMWSQETGEKPLRDLAARAATSALVNRPDHEGAEDLLRNLLDRRGPIRESDGWEGDPLDAFPELRDEVIDALPDSLRQEVLMALANQSHPLVDDALRKALADPRTIPFLTRYILKRKPGLNATGRPWWKFWG